MPAKKNAGNKSTKPKASLRKGKKIEPTRPLSMGVKDHSV